MVADGAGRETSLDDSCGAREAGTIDVCFVKKQAPAAAQNGLSRAVQVVGKAETWLVKKRPRGEPAIGNRRIAGVPSEAAEGRPHGTRPVVYSAVLRRNKDRISIVQAIFPLGKMGKAYTRINGELRS